MLANTCATSVPQAKQTKSKTTTNHKEINETSQSRVGKTRTTRRSGSNPAASASPVRKFRRKQWLGQFGLEERQLQEQELQEQELEER